MLQPLSKARSREGSQCMHAGFHFLQQYSGQKLLPRKWCHPQWVGLPTAINRTICRHRPRDWLICSGVPHWDFFHQQEKNCKSLKPEFDPHLNVEKLTQWNSPFTSQEHRGMCMPHIHNMHAYTAHTYTHKTHTYKHTQHTHTHSYTQRTQIYTQREIIYYFQFFSRTWTKQWLRYWSLLCILFCQTFRFPLSLNISPFLFWWQKWL